MASYINGKKTKDMLYYSGALFTRTYTLSEGKKAKFTPIDTVEEILKKGGYIYIPLFDMMLDPPHIMTDETIQGDINENNVYEVANRNIPSTTSSDSNERYEVLSILPKGTISQKYDCALLKGTFTYLKEGAEASFKAYGFVSLNLLKFIN